MSDEVSNQDLIRIIREQQQKIDKLEVKVDLAVKRAAAADNYSRQDCLILRGKLPFHSDPYDLRDEVMKLLSEHTGLLLVQWFVNTVHWVGKNSIVVRFNNKSVREAIYRNRIPKDKSKRGLIIHECLSADKQETVMLCARLRRAGKITTYYTQGGIIFIKSKRELPSLTINPGATEEDILALIEGQPQTYRDAVGTLPKKVQHEPNIRQNQDHDNQDEPQHEVVVEQPAHSPPSEGTQPELVDDAVEVVTEQMSQVKLPDECVGIQVGETPGVDSDGSVDTPTGDSSFGSVVAAPSTGADGKSQEEGENQPLKHQGRDPPRDKSNDKRKSSTKSGVPMEQKTPPRSTPDGNDLSVHSGSSSTNKQRKSRRQRERDDRKKEGK